MSYAKAAAGGEWEPPPLLDWTAGDGRRSGRRKRRGKKDGHESRRLIEEGGKESTGGTRKTAVV